MSFANEANPDAWSAAVAEADPDTILELAGQWAVVRDRDPQTATLIATSIGAVVARRESAGTVHTEVADRFFETLQ